MSEMIEALARQINALKRQIGVMESRDEAAQVIRLVDGVTAPAAATGLAQIYVDTSDGDLKVKFADGTIKTIVVDT